MRTWKEVLARELKDPEFNALYRGAQQESLKELLDCGVVTSANFVSLSNKTERIEWEDK